MTDDDLKVGGMSGNKDLAGQTVVVIGGTLGIGLETARRAREEGADVIITARDPDRLQRVGLELGAVSTAAFDATDFVRLERFFDELPTPIDHVLVTGPGPYYGPLGEFDFDAARRDLEAHILLPLKIARAAVGKVRPPGTLLFMGGTGGRTGTGPLAHLGADRRGTGPHQEPRARDRTDPREHDRGRLRRHTAFGPLLADQLDARREELRTTLPIRRVVGPGDIATLAIHLMINTALTGATFDIDGGQQLVEQ